MGQQRMTSGKSSGLKERMMQTWKIISDSVTGMSHQRMSMPNQDDIHCSLHSDGHAPLVMAVADGHGNSRYFRSQAGAQIATDVAVKELLRFEHEVAQSADSRFIKNRTDHIARNIVIQWRQEVERDAHECIQKEQLTREQQTMLEGENVALAYGTTLLTVLITETYILYLQLGDGDIVVVSDTDEVMRPIPVDERLLANETTSLCSKSAVYDFRLHFQWLYDEDKVPALILLSIDGYANSFQSEAGFLKVGPDVLLLMRSQGIEYVEDHLEEWLTQATERGSGDDVTLGIICRLDALKQCVLEIADEAADTIPIDRDLQAVTTTNEGNAESRC